MSCCVDPLLMVGAPGVMAMLTSVGVELDEPPQPATRTAAATIQERAPDSARERSVDGIDMGAFRCANIMLGGGGCKLSE